MERQRLYWWLFLPDGPIERYQAKMIDDCTRNTATTVGCPPDPVTTTTTTTKMEAEMAKKQITYCFIDAPIDIVVMEI